MWHKSQQYDRWEGKAGKPGSKVKLGAPHFVDFGKNMEHSHKAPNPPGSHYGMTLQEVAFSQPQKP